MSEPRSLLASVRAFAGRFLIALVVGSLLMVGVVAGVDREIERKIERIPTVDLALAAPPPEGANYLVVGSDTREFAATEFDLNAFGSPDQEPGRRSDTIMVLHVEPRAERTLVVSFPRDLWVNIPGHGYAKINSAYNYGPQVLADTITTNFGIDIHHYVELNFISFVGLVNTLGSVPVYVPYEAKDEYTGFGIPNGGCWPLDGEASLAWVRSRYLEYRDERTGRWVYADTVPDIARIGRQQDFMRRLAGIAVAKSLANPFTANSVADEVVRNLTVDAGLDKDRIFELLDAFRTLNPDDTSSLEFQTMPWRTGPNQGEQQVLYVNREVAEPLIRRLNTFDTRFRPTPDPATVRIRIVNATGREDLGLAVKQRFEELGFPVTDVSDQPRARVTETSVRYAAGQFDKAKLLLRYLEPQAALTPGEVVVSGADVELVLGRNFVEIVVPADRLQVAPPADAPVDPILDTPIELPPPPPAVELPNPAPRGSC